MTIRRGTTPTIRLGVSLDISDKPKWPIVNLAIRDMACTNVVVGRDAMQLTANSDGGTDIVARLTQAQTLGFVPGAARLQVRARTANGDAVSSAQYGFEVRGIIEDGEI